MKKSIWTLGLIAGAINTIWIIILVIQMRTTGMHGDTDLGMLIGFSAMILAFSTIFVAVKRRRDSAPDRRISFGTAFLTGLYVALIASSIYVLVWEFCYFFLVPDFFEAYAKCEVDKMVANGKPPAEVSAFAEEMRETGIRYRNPFFNIMYTYVEILPVGIIVSLIAAFVFGRRKKETTTQSTLDGK